ncbi:hypothetical protein ACUXVY_15230, partial [Chromobacterium haemolyticum]|uniref:hypothetical protein n=1 Tax=Chromobacterium haemolyticum TaxID=394935 RepID=UPI004057BE58
EDYDGRHGLGDMLFVDYILTGPAPAPAQVEQQAPYKWQPIGTAPTDGREIIAYGKFYYHRGSSSWKPEYDQDHPTALGWDVDTIYYSHGSWQTGKICGIQPTHWQPLPAAPTQDTSARLSAEAKGGE